MATLQKVNEIKLLHNGMVRGARLESTSTNRINIFSYMILRLDDCNCKLVNDLFLVHDKSIHIMLDLGPQWCKMESHCFYCLKSSTSPWSETNLNTYAKFSLNIPSFHCSQSTVQVVYAECQINWYTWGEWLVREYKKYT